jgi:stage II sporulation protein AB (anti-sigma F factor)
MKYINEMKIEFPGRSINESFARAVVASFAAQLDPTVDEINDIKTAVSEAVTNCIVHAYPEKIGTVIVKARISEDGQVEIVVKDRGVGIADIEKARTPMYSTGKDERSGMGFTIMESFMDKLSVRSKVGGGTTVRMVKKIAPRAGSR